MTVEVNVLYFAKSREVAGVSQECFQLADSATTKVLVEAIVERHPAIQSVLKSCVLALNQEYVKLNETIPLKSGDEVAVVPPLSGG